MDSDEQTFDDNGDLFKEPDDYYEPPKAATFAEHKLLSGEALKLRLVGHNPLWGHLLWNAGRTLATYLEANADTLIKGRSVLELGAGAALPGLVCVLKGAQRVVITDYPDLELIQNLHVNVADCGLPAGARVTAEGFLWGAAPDKLLALLPDGVAGFDLLILADLLFNHSEHAKLLLSIQQTLRKSAGSRVLVFFTPYRPWLLEKDMAFFDLAREGGFAVTKLLQEVMDKVMFEQDPGDEILRRTVFGYELKWKDQP